MAKTIRSQPIPQLHDLAVRGYNALTLKTNGQVDIVRNGQSVRLSFVMDGGTPLLHLDDVSCVIAPGRKPGVCQLRLWADPETRIGRVR